MSMPSFGGMPSLMSVQTPTIRLPATDNWNGLTELGKGLGSALDSYLERRALAAAEPQVEETTTERATTAEEQERAADETRRRNEELARSFVSDISDPQEQEKAYQQTLNELNQDKQGQPVSWVDQNATKTAPQYKVGDLTFNQRPTPATLNAIKYQNQADVYQQRGDAYRAGLLLARAAQERARGLEATFTEIDQTQDVDAAIQLYSDIPDGVTAVKRALPDGRIEVLLHPDGRPNEARPFAAGTPEDIFKAIKNYIKPGSWEAAALAQETRDRQRTQYERAETQYQRQEAQVQRAAEDRTLADLTQAIEYGRANDMDSMRLGELIQRREAIIQRRAGLGGPDSGAMQPGGADGANLPASLVPYAPFISRLRNRESGGDENEVSVQNAVGLDQFTQPRLDDYNKQFGTSLTVADLKNNIPLQNQVAAWHYPDIDRFIQDNGLTRYVGKKINGVEVTLDGMRAAAHLGGSPGLKRYLESNGEKDPPDGLGTRRVDYMRKFAGASVPLSPQGAAATQAGGTITGGLDMGPPTAADHRLFVLGEQEKERARLTAAGKGAAPADMTKPQEKVFEAWSKERQEIQKSMDSDAVKQRRLDELNDFYAPVLGNLIPGLMGGLTPEKAAIFGTGGTTATPGGVGTSGSGTGTPGATQAPESNPIPSPDKPLSERMAIQVAEEQRRRTERQQATKKREEQEAARQKARARLSEIERTWVETRGDAAKSRAVVAELEAMEKNGADYLTPDDRKAIERWARLLYQ